MQELVKSGEGQKLLSKEAWKSVIGKAKRDRVHDDPKLLRKKVKKKQYKKRKSAREWKARESAVQKQLTEKQQQRRENLRTRKAGQRPGRGGGQRPGFEGNAAGFINANK